MVESEGVQGVTPEAVIYRYLEAASRQPFVTDAFVRLLGADADLLGRWLNVLECPADPEALGAAVRRLSLAQLRNLAQAQAWAVLPVAGSARLGLDQWQAVLRSGFLAQVLAEQLGLPAPEAVRFRVLLAVSGVSLSHDPDLTALAEFRGVRAELLAEASPLIKVFAVVDALEVLDEFQAGQLAGRLLNIDAEQFSELIEWAGNRCASLVTELDLAAEHEADWSNRLWVQQQVGMLTELLKLGSRPDDIAHGHQFATRSLFQQVPLLLMLDTRHELVPVSGSGVSIKLDSPVSGIAQALRQGEVLPIEDSPDTAVGDRQLLRELGVADAVCIPLVGEGEAVGALLFAVDDDVDQDFARTLYAEQLAQRLAAAAHEPDVELELVKRYRQREEKRLREIVHEVNNPLSVVQNYLHILELRLQHEPSATEQLQMIGSELKRAADIVQRVRALSPIAELDGGAEVVFAEFDANELARRVFELHRGYAEDHSVTLELALSPGSARVASDEQRLAQVLNNLMRNAIEASSGATVCLGSNAGVFREGREGLELFVRDTGPGLAREVLERLADPKASSKGGDHAGLGLHIVHRLVKELQGGIDVRTTPRQGTMFTVYLPLTPL